MRRTPVDLTAVCLLLATNVVFVAAGFARSKARGSGADALAPNGKGSARLTQKIMRKLEA